MLATTTLGGTSSIKLPKDDRYVEKADNSTSGSSTKSVAIYDSPGGTSLTASVMGSSAPFNDISSKIPELENWFEQFLFALCLQFGEELPDGDVCEFTYELDTNTDEIIVKVNKWL